MRPGKTPLSALTAMLAALALAACQSPGSTGPAATAGVSRTSEFIDANGMLPPNYAAQPPHNISSSDDFVHPGTGLVLPASFGRFERRSLVGYDDKNLDTSATYSLRGAGDDVVLTAYVFPVWLFADGRLNVSDVPALCAQSFDTLKRDARFRWENPHLVAESDAVSPRFADAAVSRGAIFDVEFDKLLKTGPVRSEIHMSCGVQRIWIVQYRVTYPSGYDSEDVVREFMKLVPGDGLST